MFLFAAAKVVEEARDLSQDRRPPGPGTFRKERGSLPVGQGARFQGNLFRVLHAVPQILLQISPDVGPATLDLMIPRKKVCGNPEIFPADIIKSGGGKRSGDRPGRPDHLFIDVAWFGLQGVRSNLISTVTWVGWPGAR
jgi:hypothetical protein